MEKFTSIPEVSPKYAEHFPEVWEALRKLLRTGWVDRGIKNPESVQEHILALMALAYSLKAELPEFSEDDMAHIIEMLEVHDWPEAIEGDPVILTDNIEERARLQKEKFNKEHAALEKVTRDKGELGKKIMELWLEFEKGEGEMASFARQLDKYQAVIKAFEYEKQGWNVSTKDFIDYTRKRGLIHPLLIKKVSEIEEKLNNK